MKNLLLTALIIAFSAHSIFVYGSKDDSMNVVTPMANNGVDNGHSYVDLGLPSGLKWATCNIGANKPEEYGSYFAWGETKTKKNFHILNYKFARKDNGNLRKYCTNPKYGKVDMKKELDLEDDVAHIIWGDQWRMPTPADFGELIKNTTSEWIDNYNETGVSGYKFTATNNNYIFFPAAGGYGGKKFLHKGICGYYWANHLNNLNDNPSFAYLLHFKNEGCVPYVIQRYIGITVRPVRP